MYEDNAQFNVASSIEKGIELLMELNQEYANLTFKVKSLENRLAAVSVLIDINEYMGNILHFQDLVSYLKDVIAGVLGLDCTIYTPDDIAKMKMDPSFLPNTDLYIQNLKAQGKELFGYNSGSLGVLCISKRDLYGYLVIHHELVDMIDEEKKGLLQLIKGQICIYFENAMLFSKLRDSAEHDGLTGLYNRLYLSQLLDNWEESMVGINGAIILDLDNFKNINDTYGHLAGDNVIRMLVGVIKNAINNLPVYAIRYGGEEFLLLTKGIGSKEIVEIAETIRREFNTLKYEESSLSVSLGVSVLGESCKVIDYMELIRSADDALYTAKRIGKNVVVTSDEDLQLFESVSFNIAKNLSRYNRFNVIGEIYRVNFKANRLLSIEEYSKLKYCITSCFREYDGIYGSVSLSFVILTDNQIPQNLMEQKIREALVSNGLDYVNFEVYSNTDAYREVMLHSKRVAAISMALAEAYGLPADECEKVRLAAANHDIGKLYVNPKILNKPGKLTPEEYEKIKMHAFYSYQYAKSRENLKFVAEYIFYHHEYIDGSGYFKKKDLPLYSQIIVLADIFDALSENRCYRAAFSKDEAIQIMEGEKHKFNPELFELLKQIANNI
ncbi:bifunctional diguanylate cyclase/phosphohydrolase [Ruminiclostridium cellulolyticum]|uniref:Diguanylate cyclase and metal dependent phosphohydrolase n=1 Tax=Ruminiclostridium cellulolyticum (strain ATCC 35319 / DSM 5812 / JCM 6584 / H10) TaxID=394503 RepID=B8I668_RUMCH|nr:diguanylate cyclase [Ruminiclostridium cellulolyticum]ACL76833.1 diguanylate cyclase and metal dependent phosphohydrolase [Ruminiclostridium cellulolyticum H10]